MKLGAHRCWTGRAHWTAEATVPQREMWRDSRGPITPEQEVGPVIAAVGSWLSVKVTLGTEVAL